MLPKIGSSTIGCAFVGRLGTVLLAVAFGSTAVAAASADKPKPVNSRRVHHGYAIYRSPRSALPERLPYGPEYGFLTHVPPNAIRMPGYIFVPGVGILGESCDLPTSACPNEYRDIQ